MQRKWRRYWLLGKPSFIKKRQTVKKNNVANITTWLVKRMLPPVAAASILFFTMSSMSANPTNGQVTTGAGTIAQNGNTMTITQVTSKLGINWKNFSIGVGEKVQFIQPGANSVALNRVIGGNSSSIYGTLVANGKVFLINPNGVLFAPGAQVNVGGLVASTLNITDSDFNADKYSFSGSDGTVANQGTITVSTGGYVALLGSQVTNEGVIGAKQGKVALGAGSRITLDMNGDGMLNLAVDQAIMNASVTNHNFIQADGGNVIMTTGTKDALLKTVVSNSGIIQARSVSNQNGVIRLEGGTVTNSGTLDASGQNINQTGGVIKVLGDTINLTKSATINASGGAGGGTILIGGNYQGKGIEQNASNTTIGQDVTINADAIKKGNGGKVVVWADNNTNYYGNISAKGGANSGDGGNVEVSGKKKLLYKGFTNLTAAKGKTGNLLLDPGEYTISTATTSGNVYNATDLANQLNSANITLATDGTGTGDITAANDVTWTSGNTLTLKANNNINVDAALKSTGSGGVVLRADSDADNSGTVKFGTNGKVITDGAVSIYYNPSTTTTTTINGTATTVKNYANPTNYSGYVKKTAGTAGDLTAYMLVNNVTDLQAVNLNLGSTYAMGKDIDAIATSNWNSNGSGGYYGFDPLGDSVTKFTGVFEGDGHKIDNLYINRLSEDYIGLFGYSQGKLRNISLTGVNITGKTLVSGLVGQNNGSITNSNSAGNIVGSGNNIGGLAGDNLGTIETSYSMGMVKGNGDNTGGLVGLNTSVGTIVNSYSTGTVTGTTKVGGLVGQNQGRIENSSYRTGTVSGTSGIGGLVGWNQGHIENIYSTGTVNGTSGIGGLVGWAAAGSSIANSYSVGEVTGITGSTSVGGLAGINSGGSIKNSYSTGKVTGSSNVGGLVGNNINSGTVTDSYWDTQTSNMAKGIGSGTASGATGLTTAQMKESSSYASSWDFTNIWRSYDGHSYPLLKGLLTKLTVSADSVTKTYDGQAYTGSLTGVNYSIITDPSLLLGTLSYSNDKNAGTQSLIGLYSTSQQGYDIIYDSTSTLTINKAILTGGLTGIVEKTYDGTNAATLNNSNYSLSGKVAGDNVTLSTSTSGSYDNKNSGTGKNVTVSGLSLTGTDANNYTVSSSISGNVGVIDKAVLTAGLTGTVEKTYDGTNSATLNNSNYSLSGKVAGDNVTLSTSTSGSYDNKNAGTGKYVTVSGLSLTGTDANNYMVSSSISGNVGVIDKAVLTAGLTGTVEKTYDGTNAATLNNSNYSLSGKVAGDNVTLSTSTSGSYDSKNAGTGKKVTVSALSLTGTDANNYMVSSSISGNVGVIDKAPLTAQLTGAVEKTYDGTNAATLNNFNYNLSGIVAGDSVSVSNTGGSYDNKNVGTGKNVAVSGLSLTGTDANNYTVPSSISGNVGIIDKVALTVGLTGTVEKTYDGTNAATLNNSNYSLSGKVAGDNVTLSTNTSGSYDNKNTGTGKNVTVSGLSLTGTDANNYMVSSSISGNVGIIDKAALTVGLTGTVKKTYDGTNAATLNNSNYSLSGKVAGDNVTLSTNTSGSYDNKNAGTGKNVTVSGLSLTGTDANNYTVSSSVSGNVGVIDKTALTHITDEVPVRDKDHYKGAVAVVDHTTFNGKIHDSGTVGNLHAESMGGSVTPAVIGFGINLSGYVSPGEAILSKALVIKEKERIFTFVNFDSYTDDIPPQSYPILDQIADMAIKDLQWKLTLVIHTANIGSNESNIELSRRWAEIVQKYLISKGISEERLVIDAKGKSQPLSSDVERVVNRGVEIRMNKG